VERVLLKALAKEREDRFEDAARLVSAFKEAWNEAGVPIQGSDVSVSQVIPIEIKAEPADATEIAQPTRVASVSVPAVQTQVASVPAATARAEEKPGKAEAVPERSHEPVEGSKKKRSPFVWVGAALIVILCMGGLGVIRNNRNERLLARQTEASTLAPGGQAPVDQPKEPPPDADTHLNLALNAWHEGDMKRSMDEVNQMVALRADQGEFLIEAGTQLYDAGQYIGAAFVYARAAQNFQERNLQIPVDVRERFEASFYFAAAMDEFPLYLPLENLRNNEPSLAFFAESRYAVLHGNVDVARRNLDELLRIQPDWPLTRLLNAEVLFAEGNLLEPRKILQELLASPRMSEWIKKEADILLNQNQ
jgi:tetratricopeptide (TPR) repeat protein